MTGYNYVIPIEMGLKIPRWQHHAGSIPAPGTNSMGRSRLKLDHGRRAGYLEPKDLQSR